MGCVWWGMQQHLTLCSWLRFYSSFLSGISSFLPTMKLNSFVSLEVHNDLQQLQIHQAVQMNSYWCFRIRLLTCGVCRVDLCHQATDHDEEDDDNHYEQLLSSVHSQTSKSFYHYHTWCIPFRRIRGRQRLVILVKIASWTIHLQSGRGHSQWCVFRLTGLKVQQCNFLAFLRS